MCGTVRQVRDNFVVIEIAERKQVRLLKSSISAVVAKGRPAEALKRRACGEASRASGGDRR